MFSDDESDNGSTGGMPALLCRPVIANHICQERITMETLDREDHTFCGMMFDVKCTNKLPIEFLEISSIAVRGALGPMTVWTTPTTYERKYRNDSEWKLIYERDHTSSFRTLVDLELDEVVQLQAGGSCGLFVHSKKPGDSAVVYDNVRRGQRRCDDDTLLTILPGMAALDNRPFGDEGLWGEGWRNRREFVGRINVGVCWRLWNPEVNHLFPCCFRDAAKTLLLCGSRPECPLHVLSDAVLLYILNMCRWDWFGDDHEAAQAEDNAPANEQQDNLPYGIRGPTGWSSDSDSDGYGYSD